MKAVFLDRDGVINIERGDYTYLLDDFVLITGVTEAITELKRRGYYVIVITNQAGIAKGIYSEDQMNACHTKMQTLCNDMIDDIYYAPLHPSVSESLARKPGRLMFERAMAKYAITPKGSWMVGDKMRDLVPAKAVGLNTVLVGSQPMGPEADHRRLDLTDCLSLFN